MNYSVTYKNFNSAVNAAKMFELRKKSTLSVIEGKYRDARLAQKELAEIAINDFDTFKTLPIINFKNVPLNFWVRALCNSIKFRIYKLFTLNTPEEKQLIKMVKQYTKEVTKEDIKKKSIDITVPAFY